MADWTGAPYVRVYSTLGQDHPKVWSDVRLLGGYVKLLMAAEPAWPGLADVPRGVPSDVLAELEADEVVDVIGDSFRFHGLEAERSGRRSGAYVGGRVRAQTADRDEHGRFLPSDAGPAGRSELDELEVAGPAVAGPAGRSTVAGPASLDALDAPSVNGSKSLDRARSSTSGPAHPPARQPTEPSEEARSSGISRALAREATSPTPARVEPASPTSIRCRDYQAHRSEHRFWGAGVGWKCQVCEREDADAEAMRLETFTTKVERVAAAGRVELDDDDRPF